jgi:hypothetical protein
MIFAAATDEMTLFVFATAERALSYCEGIDVEEGGWLFWDGAGSALRAAFITPNHRDGACVGNGVYRLVPSTHLPPLSEVIMELRNLAANPHYPTLTAVRASLAAR